MSKDIRAGIFMKKVLTLYADSEFSERQRLAICVSVIAYFSEELRRVDPGGAEKILFFAIQNGVFPKAYNELMNNGEDDGED